LSVARYHQRDSVSARLPVTAKTVFSGERRVVHTTAAAVRRVLILLLLVAGACLPAAVSAEQEPATRQHIVDLWQQADGLPQNYVFTVIQSRDSYLWIGTRGGIARFDGVQFTRNSGAAPSVGRPH
jgi:hypothetical protein